MWIDLPTPVIVAHRGDKAYAPENTLSAFNQAAEKGADAIEFDVKLTLDGHVVVLHDQKVDRTTNGTGDVAKLTLAALKELDAGIQFQGKFTNEKIPGLDEVFDLIGKKLYMNIELTNYSTPHDSLISKVAEIVSGFGMQNRVLFSSFFAQNLQKIRALLPEVPRALLTMPGLLGVWGRVVGWRNDYAALNPNFVDVNNTLVSRVHRAGKKVNAWTVVSKEDIKRMIDLGVDGIITDDPGLALNVLGRRK